MAGGDDERTVTYQVGERQGGVRLDLFLKERIPKMSRSHIQAAIGERVSVGGRGPRAKPGLVLRAGDLVHVRHQTRDEPPLPPELIPRLLHVDDSLIAVDKPAGLSAHANRRTIHRHLAGWLREQFGEGVALAHRLDRETSGVTLATRGSAAARALAKAFAAGTNRKEYLAVVHGVPESAFEVDAAIGADSASRIHVKQAAHGAGAVAARTRFERERVLAGGRFALVRAFPATGRRHQIRVHLALAGHPVVGDKLYAHGDGFFLTFISHGLDPAMRERLGADRHLLHAAALEVMHPESGEPVRLTAPLPADFEAWCRA